MWWADRAAGGAVTGGEGAGDIIGLPCACADAFEAAHDAAHLIVQEGPGAQVKAVFGAVRIGQGFNPAFIECLDRRFRLTEGGAKGREVMFADQVAGPGLHRPGVKVMADLPDLTGVMHRWRAAGDKAKDIAPFDGGEPGVPVIGHGSAGDDGDGIGLEVEIQRLGQAERVPIARQIAVCHLTKGMDPRVSPARCGNRVWAWFQLCQCRLNCALNGGLVALPLPARKRGTVVFYFQGIARHGASASGEGW